MTSRSVRAPIPFNSRYREQGQALIYGLFVLMGGLAALFFLFNAGQLASEKSKLVNTADAVAYSAGVMHARALNFDAYNNRALVANEVLVAQMVSLSSWARYVQTHAENLVTVFPECADPYGSGAAAGALLNYDPLYAAMCYLTVQYAGNEIASRAKQVPSIIAPVMIVIEANKAAILAAQALLHSPLFPQMRGAVMQQVADLNYRNDGTVTVEPAGAVSTASTAMTDGWSSFTRQYSGDDRKRFAELAQLAAYRDEFVEKRSWNATALMPSLDPRCWGLRNEVRRRGGTELIGYDEWKAEDTESFWWVRGRRFSCRVRETPIAWGEQEAHPSNEDPDESGAFLGGSPSTNPGAHSRASSNDWTNYTGLPAFRDLSSSQLTEDDPTLMFSVRVARARTQARTSDAASSVAPSSRLNAYQSNFAKNVMAAVSTSEVFFERPLAHRENQFGKNLSLAKPREIGSLFNPYWQVRLIHSEADVNAQRTHQMN